VDGIVASRILWEAEPVAITANEALAAEAAGSETRTGKAEAMEFLQAALAGGPMPASEVKRMARDHGLMEKAYGQKIETAENTGVTYFRVSSPRVVRYDVWGTLLPSGR
jgi:hypothetical protein